MLNNLQNARMFHRVPPKHKAEDIHDSYLLDLAAFAEANYLVTGDKRAGLIELKRVGTARISTTAEFLKMLPRGSSLR
jgi:predicted nucleic acid-binding protein